MGRETGTTFGAGQRRVGSVDRKVRRDSLMLMLLILATIAVVLAAVGIYGVISCSVSQRAHEIGVRLALGARRAEVVGMVVRQVVVLAGIGIVLGTAGALVATMAVLATVALAAAALPAWRASRLDPASALRDE